MKSLKLLLLYSIVSVAFSFASCGNDGPGSGCNNFDQAWSDAVTSFSEIQSLYASNPTTENCETFRQGYIDYIDAIEDLLDCGDQTFDVNLQVFLDDAKLQLDDLEC